MKFKNYIYKGEEKNLFDFQPKFKQGDILSLKKEYKNSLNLLNGSDSTPYRNNKFTIYGKANKFSDEYYYTLVPIEDSVFILFSMNKKITEKLPRDATYNNGIEILAFPEKFLKKANEWILKDS